MPKLKTPWRDRTTHLVMSPLEIMLLPIEGQVCGSQTHWVDVCRRSASDSGVSDLTAAKLTPKLSDRRGDVRGRQ